MARLLWDNLSDRQIFGGTDRGVLYIEDQPGVAWNGLTSVTQRGTVENDSLYFNGRRFGINTTPAAFEGSIAALNYPVEFERAQGFEEVRPGVYTNAQRPATFGLSYRTLILDHSTKEVGYAIHILWGLKATPSDVVHNTLGATPEVTPFTWDILGIETELLGLLPSSQLIFKTTEVDPWFIADLEDLLYGDLDSPPTLPSMEDFYIWAMNWARFMVVDNGDGTWTGTEARGGHIFDQGDGVLLLEDVNVIYLDDDTFVIENTYNAFDLANVTVAEFGNIVSFNSSDPDAIVDIGGGLVDLHKIDVTPLNDDVLRIATTHNLR